MPRLPRRIALPLSLTLTVFIAFAVASFASKAGWLQAQSDNIDVVSAEAPAGPSPTPDLSTLEPLIVTDYVYQDIPVYVTREAPAAATMTTAPQPTPFIQPAQVVSSTNDDNNTQTSFSSNAGQTAVSQVEEQPQTAPSTSHEDSQDRQSGEHEDSQRESEHESEHGDD